MGDNICISCNKRECQCALISRVTTLQERVDALTKGLVKLTDISEKQNGVLKKITNILLSIAIQMKN